MNKIFKTFSLADINIIREESQTDDIDFAYAKLEFLSDGYNGQNCWMTEKTLKDWAHTVLGKFITAKYSVWENDVKSHERDLDIVGYVPERAEITYKKLEDGRTMACTECVISKIYATEVYEMFLRNDAERSVSVEFSCAMGDDAVDGEGEIIGYSIHSVTILGKRINPAIKDANIQVVKFSAKEAEDVFTRLKNRYKKNDTLEIFMSNRENLERKENSMKKINKTEIEPSIVEENVVEEKTFAEDEKKDEEVVEKQNSEDESKEVEKEEDKELSDCGSSEVEMAEEEELSEEVEMAEDKSESDEKEEDKDEDKDDEPKEEEKEMSLDAFADSGALLALLENETEDNVAFATQLFESKDVNNIIMSCLALKKENDAYKEEKALAEQKECEMKFAECMASVKGDLTEKTYASLYDEGKSISKINDFNAFTAKVKAFAYDESKIVNANKKEVQNDDVLRMGMPIVTEKVEDKDVFNRIANK